MLNRLFFHNCEENCTIDFTLFIKSSAWKGGLTVPACLPWGRTYPVFLCRARRLKTLQCMRYNERAGHIADPNRRCEPARHPQGACPIAYAIHIPRVVHHAAARYDGDPKVEGCPLDSPRHLGNRICNKGLFANPFAPEAGRRSRRSTAAAGDSAVKARADRNFRLELA